MFSACRCYENLGLTFCRWKTISLFNMYMLCNINVSIIIQGNINCQWMNWFRIVTKFCERHCDSLISLVKTLLTRMLRLWNAFSIIVPNQLLFAITNYYMKERDVKQSFLKCHTEKCSLTRQQRGNHRTLSDKNPDDNVVSPARFSGGDI